MWGTHLLSWFEREENVLKSVWNASGWGRKRNESEKSSRVEIKERRRVKNYWRGKILGREKTKKKGRRIDLRVKPK